VQALAEEKPVVAYPLDGTPEVVIDGQTGFLIPPGDHAAATEALLRILSDDTLAARMGQAGRALVKDKFPWQKMSEILIRDYEKFLARKKNA